MNTTDHANGYSRTPADLPPGMSGESQRPPIGPAVAVNSKSPENGNAPGISAGDKWALQKATEIYSSSTDYINTNVTNQWERNLLHFRNQHAPGTAYHKQEWKRSRTFRPKTRSNVKAQEASCASSVFSTQDLLDVQAQDTTNPQQVIAAQINKELVEYRLGSSEIPWFLTVIGAYQDTKVYGVCVSHQFWDYDVRRNIVPAFDEQGNPITETDAETGETVAMGREQKQVIKDGIACDLVEPENFRFDAMCDWRNPAATSPYLIRLKPMSAGDALAMMKKTDRQGKPIWRQYTLEQILSTRKENYDNRTRRAREGYNRVDPAVDKPGGGEYSTVWAHFNIVRVDGEDICWWTMGTNLMLSDPQPLSEECPWLKPGERPFVVGVSTIEAHRNYPAGDVEQAAPLQEEINSIANQRLDNVKLVLNKRYFVRRGSQIDLDALVRNVPGGGVMVNDPQKDVEVVSTQDVTSSSYQEHDRLATEFDELVGSFSQASVMNNRNLSETKGGMDRVATSAGAVQDYGVKIFFETWLEPVLKQFVRLEQLYETDKVVLAIAAKKSNLWTHYGTDQVTDELLTQDLTVRVNVAMGNTDPMTRVQRLIFGMQQAAALPGMPQRVKSSAVADEIFGAIGYKDASRFFMSDQEVQKAQPNGPPDAPDIQVKKMELQIRAKDNEQRHAKEAAELSLKREIAYAELALKEKLTMEDLYMRLGIEHAKNKTSRDTTALKEGNRLSELNHKRTTEQSTPSPKGIGKVGSIKEKSIATH